MKKLAKDPICGMEVDPSMTDLKKEHKGKTYYFCSVVCKDAFEKDPEKYAEHI